MSRRPNVLWLSTHDINPHLGCYAGVWPGAELATSPHLDQLAADGIRFDQAMAAAPVCGPSRSAIITGCFPPSIGTMHMRTRAVPPPEVQLLPTYFRAAGYWTANSSFTDFQMDVPNPVYDEFGEQVHWRHRPDPGQPFFLAVHAMTTHESMLYLTPDRHAEVTSDVPDEARISPERVELPPYHPDTDVFRTAWARYYELITQMDAWVGRWLSELAEDGLDRDTIVVFWSDHGLGMPRAKRWATEAGFREPLIMRWPGRLPAGAVCPHVVSLMDLAPTMLSLAGIDVPAHMQGQVLVAEDGTLAAGLRPYAFSGRDRMGEATDRSRSVRDDRFRYTRHYHPDRSSMVHCEYPDHLATWAELRRLHGAEAQRDLAMGRQPSILSPLQRSIVAGSRPAEELYDIAADPHEERNLASDPEYAVDLARLSAALTDWLDRVGDLAEIDESELLDRWRPGGEAPTVAAPVAMVDADGVTHLTCSTAGVVVGWTTDPEPAEPPSLTQGAAYMSYLDDGRRWRLYTGPTTVEGPAWARAWRIGWQPSDAVDIA